ncbi:MAG: 50S ribosomal protein L29 [Thermotogota bacterium]
MKFKDLKQKNKDDLNKLLKETKTELLKENAQVASGTMVKNPGKIKQLKKTIAKIKQLGTK